MSDQTPHTPDPSLIPDDIMQSVRDNASRFKTVGWVLIALGLLAILFPLVFSIGIKVVIGWFFLLTGALMLYHAFQAKAWKSALWSGAIALMHLALGVYLSFFALTGLVGLTALLGLIFLLQGLAEAVMAAQHRPKKGWGWLAFNGAVTLLAGAILILGLPGTALWAIGILAGINFLSSGIAFVQLARLANAEA